MAAVIATIFLSFLASLIKLFAYTFVYDGAFESDFCCSPVATLNLFTPWYLSSDFSAGL